MHLTRPGTPGFNEIRVKHPIDSPYLDSPPDSPHSLSMAGESDGKNRHTLNNVPALRQAQKQKTGSVLQTGQGFGKTDWW